MSATENTPSEITKYVETIAQRDLQIEELKKENKRLQLLVNSARFGSNKQSTPVKAASPDSVLMC